MHSSRTLALLSLLLAPLAAILSAPGAYALTDCTPEDLECILRATQYTVYGTAISTTEDESGSSNYNATVQVDCAYLSFSQVVSDAEGVVGSNITVQGFGTKHNNCPTSYPGAVATAGQSYVFFLYVSNTASSPDKRIYGVNNPCGGPQAWSDVLAQDISNDVANFPANAIVSLNQPAPTCSTLPAAQTTSSGTSATGTNGVSDPFKTNGAAQQKIPLAATAAGVALAFAVSLMGVLM